MAHVRSKITGGKLLAAMALGALSLSVASTAMWSAPASAFGKVKGKIIKAGDSGAVIKRRYDDGVIIAPTDADGVVRLTGLEPGEYEANLIGDTVFILIQVGSEGRMAFAAKSEMTYPDPKATDPRARRALPLVRQWVEPVAFDSGGPDRISMVSYFMGNPLLSVIAARSAATPVVPDVNTSTAEQLMHGTNNSREAAAFIIADRDKNGAYENPLDFAQRVGKTVTVDFGYSSVRIGDTFIIARGGEPKAAGFKTIGGSGVVELYGKKHNYVGHVTLLK